MESKMSFERRLLKLVSLNQLIYDNKHPDYDKRPKRKEVWQGIANLLNSDPESCKKRWVSLRATYRKLLHKIKSEGGPETYNKKWKYYDDIAFINKFECMTPLIGYPWDENSSNSTSQDNADECKASAQNLENRLLDSIRRHEVIYNPNHPGYSDVDERNFAWHSIARELNVEKSSLKLKWHSLRSAYNKILRKINAMGGMRYYKRKWIHFDNMAFLNPYIPRLLPPDLLKETISNNTTYEVAQMYKEEPADIYDSNTSNHYGQEEYADEHEHSTETEHAATADRIPSEISGITDNFENTLEYNDHNEIDEHELQHFEGEKNDAFAHEEYDEESNSVASPPPAKKRRFKNEEKDTRTSTATSPAVSVGPCNTYFSLLGSKIDETPVPPSERYLLEKRVTDLVYEVLAKYS